MSLPDGELYGYEYTIYLVDLSGDPNIFPALKHEDYNRDTAGVPGTLAKNLSTCAIHYDDVMKCS